MCAFSAFETGSCSKDESVFSGGTQIASRCDEKRYACTFFISPWWANKGSVFFMKNKNEEKLFTLVCLALLTAMQVVFARFLVIPISDSLRFSLSFIPVVIAARRFGIAGSVTVYALGDFIGAFAFPALGAYFPGYTLTAAVSGFIFGIFLRKKSTVPNIALSVVLSQICCSLLLNTFWISIQYGSSFTVLLASRAVQCLVVGILQILFMVLFLEKICNAIKMPSK